jgi:hypothetical protein
MTWLRALPAVAVMATLVQGAGQQRTQPACATPRPAGVAALDKTYFERPWIIDAAAPSDTGLRMLVSEHSVVSGDVFVKPVEIRLDDGSLGRLSVEPGVCRNAAECLPEDCGCPGVGESFFVEVSTSDGRSIARWHLWAAYGVLQIVPVDLADGPGDEFVVIRIPAHASPPIGYDMKIWKLNGATVSELATDISVEKSLGSFPFACARWRDAVVVDSRSSKPRTIELRPTIAMTECCHVLSVREYTDIEPEDLKSIDAAHRLRTLRYDPATKKYLVH